MKNTALNQVHINLGAKMVPFAGYNMPVQYAGINAEHETVRKGVGVFDVSHMGEFILKAMTLQNFMTARCNTRACPIKMAVLLTTCWFTALTDKPTCW